MRFQNPYSSHSSGLSFSLPGKNTKEMGSSLCLGRYSISFLSGERTGFGINGSYGKMNGLCYFFLGENDNNIERKALERLDSATLYLGGDWRGENLEASFLSSMTSSLLFSSFVSSVLKLGPLSLGLSYGRVQPLLNGGKDWKNGVSISLKEKSYELSYEVLLGDEPVLIPSFRNLSFTSKGKISLGPVTLSSKGVRSFRDGREDTEHSMTLEGDWWRITLSTKSGLTLALHFSDASMTINEEKIVTHVSYDFGDMAVSASSESLSSLKGEIEL